MTKPNIAIIIGTTREHRFADKPAAWLLEQAQKRDDMTVELVDLRDFDLPFFDEAGPIAFMPSQDKAALAWQEKIAQFDGYIFMTAEYNSSLPAVTKNALDQAYSQWNRKAAATFGYGGLGAARAVEHLRNILIALQMVPVRNGVNLGSGEFFKVSPLGANGEMAEVEAILAPSATAMFDDLVWWANATKTAREAN